jgi:hypothetical protein
MKQDDRRLEKDYDDVSRELTGDPIRFNYNILKNKGVILSMTKEKAEQTVKDSSKAE